MWIIRIVGFTPSFQAFFSHFFVCIFASLLLCSTQLRQWVFHLLARSLCLLISMASFFDCVSMSFIYIFWWIFFFVAFLSETYSFSLLSTPKCVRATTFFFGRILNWILERMCCRQSAGNCFFLFISMKLSSINNLDFILEKEKKKKKNQHRN